MICYLVRHGQDDDTVRGGWAKILLTEEGHAQAEALAEKMDADRETYAIRRIFSSDLPRALETAEPVSRRLGLPIVRVPEFREVNNGDLAGMKNTEALERYPGLFWNTLAWEETYPNGESPRMFVERITAAWDDFSKKIAGNDENVLLVTHSGVIHVILACLRGEVYSNQGRHDRVGHTQIIPLLYENGGWRIL